MNSLPSLEQLAQPLQEQGLPEGISLSVGIIASTPPRTLTAVLDHTNSTHFKTEREARPTLSELVRQSAERLTAQAERSIAVRKEDASTEARRLQDRAAMMMSVGIAPSAADLNLLLAEQELLEQLEGQDPNNHPKVVARQAKYVELATERFLAEQALAYTTAPHELAIHIREERIRLSRRGRLASVAAGMLLSVGTFFLGISVAEQNAAKPPTAEQQELRDQSIPAIGGAAVAAGTLAGMAAGMKLSNRFAKHRASRLVAKAKRRSKK